MDHEPPFQETYKNLLHLPCDHEPKDENVFMVEECDLPMIDLSRLDLERGKCMKEIARAAREWGFFQVVNHGVSKEVLSSLKYEQMKVFRLPFKKKMEDDFLNLSAKSYRWGNSKATSLKQVPWSEAFHFSISDISRMNGYKSLRYPPCPFAPEVFGLMPHTDSSFLTILHQDQVGGLQFMKDGKWFRVKPNPEALIVNIGDLFQALSNDVFKSIKHKVVSSGDVERFSVAYFYCPSAEAVIQSCTKPALYKQFSFKEYQQQTQKDVQDTGDKVGLSRFLL
ncbi:hypothetical protein I3843_11G179700 [Carya illinoinensis]|uniref:Fe2OG dioxygenase domain-containing protein n=1 Tax=Carya illinoinensis TaxID=32201 RepID=A0A922J0X2_CARIL|nr:hypothetical protein I3842_11G181600 [Carya illinoinensis]KAG7957524.1 hypothetical protein I3843_11G179700 [Carya illinoinensis]